MAVSILRHLIPLKYLGYTYKSEIHCLKDKLINSDSDIFVADISRYPAYKKQAKYTITVTECTRQDEYKTVFKWNSFSQLKT